MADEFEYQAVPKFIDFQNENEDFEKSAFFKGDNLIQPSPQPQRNAASHCPGANDRILAPVDRVSPLKKSSVRVTNDEKATTGAPAPPIKAPSNLALFNHGASRIAEKARRRSQQIQAPPENRLKERNRAVPFTQILRSYNPPTGTTPSKPLTKPNPFPLRRSTSRCRDTQADIDPRIRASVDRLSTPLKSRSVRVTNGEKATTGAPAPHIKASSSTPLKSRSVRVTNGEKATTGAPAIKASSSTPLKSRSVRVTNGEKATTGAPAPLIKASSNLALFNHGASRIAEKARRRSQQIQAPPENPPQDRNRAVPFAHILRSYKPPTGTTPSKPLTKSNPFPLRRSSSRCRDTQADIDPRIRASVDRLSTPRIRAPVVRSSAPQKRENLRSMK